MEDNGFHRIDPSAKKVWIINGLIGSLFILAIAFVIFLFLQHWLVLAQAGLIFLYMVVVHPQLEYRQWSYQITDISICYNHGIYARRFTIIPISRIQHLEIRQGPVLKHFKLSNVEIYTAGQAHLIVALKTDEAEGIVESINQIIAKENNDG